MCRWNHAEPSINFGIINSITKLHLVGVSTELVLDVPVTFIATLLFWLKWENYGYLTQSSTSHCRNFERGSCVNVNGAKNYAQKKI